MRMTQPFGLNDRAKRFLDENCKLAPSETCPHCKEPIRWNKAFEKYGSIPGMCGGEDNVDLYIYELKDGVRKVKTVEQFTVWSSGPMIFECLEEYGKRFCEWTREEVLITSGEDLLGDES